MIPQVVFKAGIAQPPAMSDKPPIGHNPVQTAPSARGPQFGNGLAPLRRMANAMGQSATDRLIPIFQKITEVFIWAFLAQDAIAMWLPRVGTSLTTGRIHYEPNEDPAAKNLPFNEQAKLWLRKNIKGLNWINFNEETKREFATGPGVLMIPAITFLIARRLFGKSAVEMGYGDLKEMSHGFMAHLEREGSALKGLSGDVAQNAYRDELKKYLAGLFDDDAMKATVKEGQQTYGQYIDDWADRWVKAVFDSTGRKAKSEAMDTLAEEMKEAMTAFNRKHRVLAYDFKFVRDGVEKVIAVERPLHRSDYVWTAANKLHAPKHETIGHLLKNIRRWSDLAEAVWQEKRFGNNNGVVQKTVAEITENVFKRIAGKKLAIAIGTTLLAGAYLVKLAFWAQNHDSYGATRLLKEGGNGHAAPAAAKTPGAHTGGHVPVPPPPQAQAPTFVQPSPSFVPFPSSIPAAYPVPGFGAPGSFNPSAYALQRPAVFRGYEQAAQQGGQR